MDSTTSPLSSAAIVFAWFFCFCAAIMVTPFSSSSSSHGVAFAAAETTTTYACTAQCVPAPNAAKLHDETLFTTKCGGTATATPSLAEVHSHHCVGKPSGLYEACVDTTCAEVCAGETTLPSLVVKGEYQYRCFSATQTGYKFSEYDKLTAQHLALEQSVAMGCEGAPGAHYMGMMGGMYMNGASMMGDNSCTAGRWNNTAATATALATSNANRAALTALATFAVAFTAFAAL